MHKLLCITKKLLYTKKCCVRITSVTELANKMFEFARLSFVSGIWNNLTDKNN